MSEENVEIVRSICERSIAANWDAAARRAEPTSKSPFSEGRMPGTHQGLDSIRAILEDQRGRPSKPPGFRSRSLTALAKRERRENIPEDLELLLRAEETSVTLT